VEGEHVRELLVEREDLRRDVGLSIEGARVAIYKTERKKDEGGSSVVLHA